MLILVRSGSSTYLHDAFPVTDGSPTTTHAATVHRDIPDPLHYSSYVGGGVLILCIREEGHRIMSLGDARETEQRAEMPGVKKPPA